MAGKDKFEYEFEEPYRPYGNSDTSDTALFREISDEREDTRYKRKPYQESDPSQQKVNNNNRPCGGGVGLSRILKIISNSMKSCHVMGK